MHFHIGKNNVFGREFLKKNDVIVLSHKEFYELPIKFLSKCTLLSVSAFDPNLKFQYLQGEDLLTSNIIECFNRDVNFVYFSTARALENTCPEHHKIYAYNKEWIYKILSSHFLNSTCVYVPNIIPDIIPGVSKFVDTYISNLQRGIVKFDLDLPSVWSFVDLPSLISMMDRTILIKDRYLIKSKKPTTVADFVQTAKKHVPNGLIVEYGNDTKSYPDTNIIHKDVKVLELENTNPKWLSNLVRIYVR